MEQSFNPTPGRTWLRDNWRSTLLQCGTAKENAFIRRKTSTLWASSVAEMILSALHSLSHVILTQSTRVIILHMRELRCGEIYYQRTDKVEESEFKPKSAWLQSQLYLHNAGLEGELNANQNV